MKYIILFITFLCVSTAIEAQNNAGLQKITGVVEKLRTQKATKTASLSAVSALADGHEVITLLDDIGADKKAEYHGTNSDSYRLNSIVSQAYAAKMGANMSKGNYNDSRQRGIFYSLIEKTVKAGVDADFTITEHCGNQEIIVLPFNNYDLCSVTVTCNGRKVQSYGKKEKYVFSIESVTRQDVIHIKVSNKSRQFVSFAILNYNPQK